MHITGNNLVVEQDPNSWADDKRYSHETLRSSSIILFKVRLLNE